MGKDILRSLLILGFSVPLLFGFLFQQLYSMVDTIIVGRFLGVNALQFIQPHPYKLFRKGGIRPQFPADSGPDPFLMGIVHNHLYHPEHRFMVGIINIVQFRILPVDGQALFRASIFGTIAIMYPMIISVNEVRKIKEIVAEVKKELA